MDFRRLLPEIRWHSRLSPGSARRRGYVPMEYCATVPPNHSAAPGAVFGRLDLSHRHPEILCLAAGIRELAVSTGGAPGETGGVAGTRFFLLRGPLRAGAGYGHDGPVGQRVSEDRRS